MLFRRVSGLGGKTAGTEVSFLALSGATVRLYDCTTVDLCNGRLSAITTLDHVFFEDPKLQSLLGNDLLLITGFAAEIFNLISGRRTQRVASKPLLASFHKVL